LINVQHALDLAEQGEKVIYLLSGAVDLPENKTLAESAIITKHLYSGN
jgi:uroporphyrin-III C-methyltransferase/precorrin-2 dehydrogenase/sirohydrochlorin ferrochelatase